MIKYIKYYIFLLCTFIAIFFIVTAIMCFIFWTIPDLKKTPINWAYVRILLILHNIPTLYFYYKSNENEGNNGKLH